MEHFVFTRDNIMGYRSSTGGYQMKALSGDRSLFIKAQAVIGGILMDDWIVERIASDFAKVLGIPAVEQHTCEIEYCGKLFRGVYSHNFERDGYEFISFHTLISRRGLSVRDDAYIRLDAADKLRWCAEQMAAGAGLPYPACERYMLDLAVLDCLVGNVDRHAHNFGVFYHSVSGMYETARVFDCGMGLFEHDPYRDTYGTFEAAMGNVYVSPYGEDPFELLEIISGKYDLSVYPFRKLEMPAELPNVHAKRYLQEMISRLKRICQQ